MTTILSLPWIQFNNLYPRAVPSHYELTHCYGNIDSVGMTIGSNRRNNVHQKTILMNPSDETITLPNHWSKQPLEVHVYFVSIIYYLRTWQ